MTKDLLINDTIQIRNGDFDIGNSDQQHVQAVIESHVGQFYQYPTLGVGIRSQLSGNINVIKIQKKIRKHLEFDNNKVLKVDVLTDSNGKLGINIEAERK